MARGISGGVKGAPLPVNRQFALGTRPQSLRGQTPLRIKPGAPGTTQYGKKPTNASPSNPFPQGASYGDTGQTDMS